MSDLHQSVNILNDLPKPLRPFPRFFDLVIGTIVLGGVLLCILFGMLINNWVLASQVADQQQKIDTLEQQVSKIKNKFAKQNVQFLGLLPKNVSLNKKGYFNYFLDLGFKNETRSWLTSISFEEGIEYIEFKGIAETPQAIYQFIADLGKTRAYQSESFSIFSINDQLIPKEDEKTTRRIRRPVKEQAETDAVINLPEAGLYRFVLRNKVKVIPEEVDKKKPKLIRGSR